MFRANEIYYTTGSLEALIVKTDCMMTYSNKKCPILALVGMPNFNANTKAGQSHMAIFYTEDGKYMGQGNTTYDLVSNDPTAEEAELIGQIGDICEGSVSNREEAMLKVIRQLRKK